MRVGMGGQEFISSLVPHMRATPQIIVAAVHGAAFGGGLSLACAADVRIAARSARFCSAFIRTGLSGTDIGISYLLPRLVGVSRGFDLIVSGREIDAVEAERIGLVSQVVDDDVLLDAALDYARTVAGYTSTGLALTKEVLWHNVEVTSMGAAIALENRNQNLAGHAADVREFMASYRERIVGGAGKGPIAVIRVADDGRVRVVTLDRPDKLNAFNNAMYFAATDALQAAAHDPNVAVVVITGEGRAFSAGADVVEMADTAIGLRSGNGRGRPTWLHRLRRHCSRPSRSRCSPR